MLIGRIAVIALASSSCSRAAPPSVPRDNLAASAASAHPLDERAGLETADAGARKSLPISSTTAAPSPPSSARSALGTTVPSDRCPPDMAFLSGGTYKMEELGNTVTVQPFCLDRTEVTTRAYEQCVQSKKCDDRGLRCALATNYGHPEKADHPINCVDWKQGVTYCQSLGKRLPSEEEWEWAARGQEEAREYPWGAGDPRSIVCWSGATDRSGTCKVGAFPASDTAAGIHDLAGNVWEWTSSSYSPRSNAKVNRGGGWISNRVADLGASNRYADDPTNHTGYDGFRCAK